MLLIAFAFLAGIVTVLSPCILPVLPIVLSGSLTGGKKRPLGIILGFILSFTFFTLFSFALLQLLGIPPDTLRIVAIAILALFGISLFVPQLQVYLERMMSFLASKRSGQTQHEGFGGGIVVGVSLGLLWTPCVGPILGSVIALAATSSVTFLALFITLAYSIGTALPLLAIMFGGRQLLSKAPWITRNAGKSRSFSASSCSFWLWRSP